MFEETRKMMELFEKVGSKKVLIAGIDVSKEQVHHCSCKRHV